MISGAMTTQPQLVEHQTEFVRLLTDHQASLRAYIISLMPGQSGAHDVLQETNIVLWEKRAKFEIGTNFTAWAFAITRYCVLEHRRKQRRDDILIFNDDLLQKLTLDPEQLAPTHLEDRQIALESCLAKLDENDQQLINYRYTKGKSVEEYSEEVGKSAGALRVALFRIRTALRRCVTRQLANERSL